MANTINPKHLDFLDLYFDNGMNATRAYNAVYPNSSLPACQSSASNLIKLLRPEIERRQDEIKLKGEIKRESIVGELKKLVDRCIKDDDRPNLIKSINLLARIAGLYTDPQDAPSDKISINLNLSDNPIPEQNNDSTEYEEI